MKNVDPNENTLSTKYGNETWHLSIKSLYKTIFNEMFNLKGSIPKEISSQLQLIIYGHVEMRHKLSKTIIITEINYLRPQLF